MIPSNAVLFVLYQECILLLLLILLGKGSCFKLYLCVIKLTWNFRSHDGSILMFSSADGYCSAAVFSQGELGTKYEKLPDYNAAEHDIEMMDIPDSTTAITTNTNMPQKRRVSASITTSTTSAAATTIHQQTVTPSSSLLATPVMVEKTKKRRITPILISTPLGQQQPPSSS